MKKIISIILIGFTLAITSCEKPAGEGGNSAIKGNIYAKDWNSSFTVITSEGPGQNIDVFIIYGNEISYGDKISTSPDGTYEFKYLRPGSYKIYVYSKTTVSASPNGETAISIDVEITKKKQVVDAGKITINV
ncbi:MAG: hypothetical protein K8R85_06340 [Bacteroidetes bacterium]|nr:hypothetical protein [Bacteroidota bacterium]